MKAILYDTDFLIALFDQHQSTHERAISLFQKIKEKPFFVLKLVHFELATVLSYRFSSEFVDGVLGQFNQLPIQFLSVDDFEPEVWEEFYAHTKKRISFVDCANKVVALKHGMKIASFDAFYPKELLV